MIPHAAPRILIADDEAPTRTLIAEILTQFGAQVTAEVNGAEAVMRAALLPFDAVVLDIEMPVMNGLDACRQIRANSFTKDVPILILTGRSDAETIDAAFAAGAWDFLNKPVHGLLLWRRISNMLALAQATRQSRDLESIIKLSEMPGKSPHPAH